MKKGFRLLWSLAIWLCARWRHICPKARRTFQESAAWARKSSSNTAKYLSEVIRTYALENNLSEKDVPVKRSARPHRPNRLGSTHRETQKLVLQKMSIEKIASMRGITFRTIAAHIEKLLSNGEKIDIDYLRPPVEKFETIKDAFQKSGGTALCAGSGNAG